MLTKTVTIKWTQVLPEPNDIERFIINQVNPDLSTTQVGVLEFSQPLPEYQYTFNVDIEPGTSITNTYQVISVDTYGLTNTSENVEVIIEEIAPDAPVIVETEVS